MLQNWVEIGTGLLMTMETMKRISFRLAIGCVAALAATGCVKNLVDNETFGCRTNADCVAGYICTKSISSTLDDGTTGGVCVIPCAQDDDCGGNESCHPQLKFCVTGEITGDTQITDTVVDTTTPDTSDVTKPDTSDGTVPDTTTTDTITGDVTCPDPSCTPGESVCAGTSRSYCQDVGKGCTRFVTEACKNGGTCTSGKCPECQDDADCPSAGKTGCEGANNKYAYTCVADADNDSCLEKKFRICDVGCSKFTGDCCTHQCESNETGCQMIGGKTRPFTCTTPTADEPCRTKQFGAPCDSTLGEVCDSTKGRCQLLCPTGMVAVNNSYCIDIYENSINPSDSKTQSVIGVDPSTNVTPKDAKALCTAVGKRLCTLSELSRSCRGAGDYKFPYGFTFTTFNKQACDVSDTGADLHKTGALTNCTTEDGVADITGNVWEIANFTDTDTTTVIFGGDYQGLGPEDFSCCDDSSLSGKQCSGLSAPTTRIIPVDPLPTQIDTDGKILDQNNKPVVTGVRCCCAKGECP